MDAVDLEVWMLKASALASSVAAGDIHEGVVEVANWLLKTYEGVAAVREELRKDRAAGYAEAKEQASECAERLATEQLDDNKAEPKLRYRMCRIVAERIRALAPATTKEPT